MSRVVEHTALWWATENPILADEQEGIETDTLRQKYGDGVTAWNDLEYTGIKREGRHLTAEDCVCTGIKDTVIDENECTVKDRIIIGNSKTLKGTI